MKDYSELKKLAEALIDLNRKNLMDWAAAVEDARIGKTHTEYALSANPADVLALIAEVEDLRKGRTDWQAECLKRGFEYVRESDDHYVLADTQEMAELLGLLLGVEVRSKDNDSYGETVSMLQDMADANSDAFHRAYELEKENESLKKDADWYRWLSKNGELIPEFDGNDWVVIYLDNGAGGFGAGVFDAKFSTFCEAVDFSMSKKS